LAATFSISFSFDGKTETRRVTYEIDEPLGETVQPVASPETPLPVEPSQTGGAEGGGEPTAGDAEHKATPATVQRPATYTVADLRRLAGLGKTAINRYAEAAAAQNGNDTEGSQ
jgi:hypothetical protein